MKITSLIDEQSISKASLTQQFAKDVLAGFEAEQKYLSSKYYYDDKGSEFFQAITEQPEYYVTQAELDSLTSIQYHLPEMIGHKEIDIIELGSGNGEKAKIIIDGFLEKGCQVNFFPIDISAKAMEFLSGNLPEHRNFSAHGIVSEYTEGLQYLRNQSTNPLLVLFLGSSIGNFLKPAQEKFLTTIRKSIGADDFLLLGVDLRKDFQAHNASFNDKAGMTAQFNLNLLNRINQELGGNADLAKFNYYSYFNPVIGAMESYIVSTEKQDVFISTLDKSFSFGKFEPIHVEYSFKFLPEEVESLAQVAGFSIKHHFCDAKEYFMDSLWQAKQDV